MNTEGLNIKEQCITWGLKVGFTILKTEEKDTSNETLTTFTTYYLWPQINQKNS